MHGNILQLFRTKSNMARAKSIQKLVES